MLTPETCQVQLVAKPTSIPFVADRTEKWMGVSYRVEPFSQEQINCWTRVSENPLISYPRRNLFIPDSLGLHGLRFLLFPSPLLQ